MMRLPPFRYLAPRRVEEVVGILAAEGPEARIVAGGTDLYPNMKRRHQKASTLVALAGVEGLADVTAEADGTLTLGAGATLRSIERSPAAQAWAPALVEAVTTISTPILRNMGTIGGNVCLDTRCNYYNQTWEWRRAIDFCMKCDGTVCWVAPSSPRCWAVNSSDSVPVLIALGAVARLVGPEGTREVPVAGLFHDDGMAYLTKRPEEVLVALVVPPQGTARSTYRKVRRRGAFDFPVAGVAVRLQQEGDRVTEVAIVVNGVGSAPIRCTDAEALLVGEHLDAERIEAAAQAAWKPARPLDNTDHQHSWRKRMVRVEVRRALEALRR
jgi:4-hydroxybenzoyl-CoA reductase subunit beta